MSPSQSSRSQLQDPSPSGRPVQFQNSDGQENTMGQEAAFDIDKLMLPVPHASLEKEEPATN